MRRSGVQAFRHSGVHADKVDDRPVPVDPERPNARTPDRVPAQRVEPAERLNAPPLPVDHLEPVEAWGMTARSLSYVYRPSTVAGVRELFETARCHGRSVALRGAGRSYGDASLNRENLVLDLTRMNRILDWDPGTGVICVEPGVTIRQL